MHKNTPYRFNSGRLWLALRLPDLPAHALAVESHDDAVQIIAEKRRVIWASPAAIESGVTVDMDVTTAQLLSGGIHQERDRVCENSFLAGLCERLYDFTPYIETYVSNEIPQSGLLLEISSCLMLFGGAQVIAEKVNDYFLTQKIAIALGLAHSAKAAWLLSFSYFPVQGNETKVVFVERLKQLSINVLHDYPKEVDALEKTGFVTLGDIAKQIEVQTISSIKKRFGKSFAEALCDIFGIDVDFQQGSLFEKPVKLYKPQAFFLEEIQFEYPIHQLEQLQQPIEDLLKKLTAFLRKQQCETHHIEWILSDIYHNKEILSVYADSAQTQWQLLCDLTLIQLENRDLPFEVDALCLTCRDVQPLQARTASFDFESNKKSTKENFTITAAKLKARLGDTSVYKLSYRDSYIPDVSNHVIALNQSSQQQLPDYHMAGLRPSWLFKEPIEIERRTQGLYWRGYLSLLAGPERLQGNWWALPSARDYFLAQRKDYVRLWVFWDLHKNNWFVQGIFA